MFWESVRTMASKEILHVTRNKLILRMMLFMQTLQLLMLAFIDVNARDLPTVVVDQDQSAYSRELVQKMRATKTFDIKYTTSSVAQARDHIRVGRARVAIVIPPNFHADRARRGNTKILALIDGSDASVSGQALDAIAGMTGALNAPEGGGEHARRTTLHSLMLFNPQGKTSHFMLPGLLVFVLAMAYLGQAGMALVREREQGNLERLLMTPLNYTGLLVGKLVPYLAMGFGNALLFMLAMRWVFGVPIKGSVVLLAVSTFLFLLTMLALGLYFAAGAKSMAEMGPRIAAFTAPMMMLSGYIFPLSSLPKSLLPIAYALPLTHMMEIIRGVTLRGSNINDLMGHMIYLVVAPAVLLVLAARKFNASVFS